MPASGGLTAAFTGLPPEYAIPERPPTLVQAQEYCRRLARNHYENFSVASWFLPKRFREHFFSIYAYCRISDDLGDEVADPQQAFALLDAWESELNATYLSLVERLPHEVRANVEMLQSAPTTRNVVSPRHPVFIALRETIAACSIPRQPFADLLKAFRQDQVVKRYQTFDELLGYCHYSANPVGRLVLYACGYSDSERQQLSDHTCTALQLANFWQDVALDYCKGRIYLPWEDLHRFRVSQDVIASGKANAEFRELMRFQVARARAWFDRGLALAGKVDPALAVDIELFTRGGQEILNAIERQGYDVLQRRPVIPTSRKLWLVVRSALRRLL